ncbi:hypothetical protein [Aliikangiella sp. IMCC44359]|uniref:hypothetical protein n=1 Tax=Aliikangiella sp. IMCC44359 TaxID=3459125 RepID=UPI00403A93E7
MKHYSKFLLIIGLLNIFGGFGSVVSAAEKIEETVLGMNVTGTKDLPNVLYIIPWKGNKTQVAPPEITRLVDEIYSPVDPEVFTKQVKFYYQLTTKSIEPTANAGQVQ